tara:strand:+ start:3088 stop:3309 length:222 start_codon:yes stop_codon:yes gene_type:complete
MKYILQNKRFAAIVVATGLLSCIATISINVGKGSIDSVEDEVVTEELNIESQYYQAVDNKNSDVMFAPYIKSN